MLSVNWTRAQARASLGVVLPILGLFAVSHASAAVQQPLTRDVDCLAAAVYYEARGESAAGQAAVAQVVLNRARKAGFPKSVCGVIYQSAHGHGCQFSFVCSGVMDHPRDATAWNSSRRVAARALGGYVMKEVGAAISFHAARLGTRPDAHMSRIARVGAHVFLVDAPREERPSSAPDAAETRSSATLAAS